jgi:hypothetical protein
MLCRKCIEQVVKKLTPNDIYVLHELKDSVVVQTGASKKELLESLKNIMSIFQLSQALMRLELVGFVDGMKIGKSTAYYITSEGLLALDILSNR